MFVFVDRSLTQDFTTSQNHTSQSSDPVTAKSDTEVNDEDNMNSELTVTPDSDTTYTCSVTDPLGNNADPKTAKLNVFGGSSCFLYFFESFFRPVFLYFFDMARFSRLNKRLHVS